ncbi:MAG: hypothetical protein WCB68_04735 [Pyrinomonadaceae bacterium]
MKPLAYWLLIAAVVALFCLEGWKGYAQRDDSQKSSRTVWEYKTIRGNKALRDDELDAMGAQGWELALYDPALRGSGSDKGTFYFKRPRP